MCPEVFAMGDDKSEVIMEEVPPEEEECCREAAENCPTDAIEIGD
jgi:ferredoxin